MRPWVAAAGLAAACGAPAAPPATPQPVPVPARVGHAPGVSRYLTRSHLLVEQEISGQVQESRLDLSYFLTAAVADDAGGLTATLIIDSVTRYEGNAAAAADYGKAPGARFSGRLMPDGELANFGGGDSTVRFLRELTDELREFFPRLPAGGAVSGARWVDTTGRRSTSSGVPLEIRMISQHEVRDPEGHAGESALPIRSRTAYTFEGTGAQGGQEFRVEGSGHRSTVEFLSLGGRYLGLVAADSSTFTITLRAVGLVIPGRQTRADTVSVVK